MDKTPLMHLLPASGLLLVRLKEALVPCFIRTQRLRLFEDLYPAVCQCEHLILCRERVDGSGETLLLMLVWYRGHSRQFVHCWLNVDAVRLVGGLPIRRIQRAWRSALERRRLAVCMASHPRLGAGSPLLAEALRVLCLEDVRRMGV